MVELPFDSIDIDPNKLIAFKESEDIVSFEAYFSTLYEADAEDEGISPGRYRLFAEKGEDGGTTGFYSPDSVRRDLGERYLVEGDAGFMKALDEIVKKYDLASRNGIYHSVSGLPDNFGASLNIEYASGETISCSDNQGNFLETAAMKELLELFKNYASEEPSEPVYEEEDAELPPEE